MSEKMKWGSHIPALEAVLESCDIKEVIEIGCGIYSTPKWEGLNLLYSEDTNRKWIEKIEKEVGIKVTYFEGLGENKNFESYKKITEKQKLAFQKHYQDIAGRLGSKCGNRLLFIDGAAYLRGISTKVLSEYCDVVIAHDTQQVDVDYYGYDFDLMKDWKRYDLCFLFSDLPKTTVFMKSSNLKFEESISGKIEKFRKMGPGGLKNIGFLKGVDRMVPAKGRSVVAMSLYGKSKCYYDGAVKNIKDIRKYYPGFEIRLYMTQSAYDLAIGNGYKLDGVEIVICKEESGCIPSIYRLLLLEDESIDVGLIRDADSEICEKEVDAVGQWIESGLDFHIMRDHPCHQRKMNAGMIGFRGEFVKKANAEIGKFVTSHIDFAVSSKKDHYGIDEGFLSDKKFWLLVKESLMVHVGNGAVKFGENEIPFRLPGLVCSNTENRKCKDQLQERRRTFEKYAVSNLWGCSESISGPGSTCAATKIIRKTLPIALRILGVKNIFDIPCGDGNWMSKVDFGEISYKGMDISEVAINKAVKNGLKNVEVGDLLTCNLTGVDFIFIRDALVHCHLSLILKILNRIDNSDVKYIGMTHFFAEGCNSDLNTGTIGGWRPLNMCKEPFCFPEPVLILAEGHHQPDGKYWDKSIGIWRVSDLPNFKT